MILRGLILWAGVLLALPARGIEPEPDIAIQVRPLVPFVRSGGSPLPVRVDLRMGRPEFRGSLEVYIGTRSGPVWRRELNVGQGRYQFMAYPVAGQEDLTSLYVCLLDERDRLLATREIGLHPVRASMTVLAVTDRGRQLEVLQGNRDRVAVAPTHDPAFLPDHWSGYTMFDSVFWDVGQAVALTREQLNALRDWVRCGGRLVLGATADDVRFASPVPDLMPELRVTRAAPGGPASILWDVREFPCGAQELFARKDVGLGSIAFLRTDYRTMRFVNMSQVGTLFSGAVEWLTDIETRFAQGDPYDDYSPEAALRVSLGTLAGAEPVRFGVLLWVLIPYVVCVTCLDCWFGRKIRRPGISWLTFPTMIACFSAVSFVAFYQGALGNSRQARLTLVDVGLDGTSRTTTWTCLRGQYAGAARCSVSPGSLVVPFITEGNDTRYYYHRSRWGRAGEGGREVLGTSGGRVVEFRGPVGMFHFLREERPESMGVPGPDAEISRGANGILRGRLAPSSIRPEMACLIHKQQVYPFDKTGNLDVRRSTGLAEHLPLVTSFGPIDRGSPGSDAHSRDTVACQRIDDFALGSLFREFQASRWTSSEESPGTLTLDRRMAAVSLRDDHALLVVALPPASQSARTSVREMTYVRRLVPVRWMPQWKEE